MTYYCIDLGRLGVREIDFYKYASKIAELHIYESIVRLCRVKEYLPMRISFGYASLTQTLCKNIRPTRIKFFFFIFFHDEVHLFYGGSAKDCIFEISHHK